MLVIFILLTLHRVITGYVKDLHTLASFIVTVAGLAWCRRGDCAGPCVK